MGQSDGFLGQHHHAHCALMSVPSPDGECSAQPAQTVLSKPPTNPSSAGTTATSTGTPPPALSLFLFLSSNTAVHHHRPTIHHGNRLVRILTSVRQTISTCPGRRKQVFVENDPIYRSLLPAAFASRRILSSIVDFLRSLRGHGVETRRQGDGTELGTPRAGVPSRGSRWRGPAGIYGTTPWIVTCQPPPLCIGMRKRILNRYASRLHMHPTQIHAYTRSVHAPPCSCRRPVGVSRGSLVRLSKSCLRGRSMSSLLCRGADRNA